AEPAPPLCSRGGPAGLASAAPAADSPGQSPRGATASIPPASQPAPNGSTGPTTGWVGAGDPAGPARPQATATPLAGTTSQAAPADAGDSGRQATEPLPLSPSGLPLRQRPAARPPRAPHRDAQHPSGAQQPSVAQQPIVA